MRTDPQWSDQQYVPSASPGARVLALLASAATVLGAALPFLSPGGPDSQLFASGIDVVVIYVLLAVLLLVGVFATSRSSAAVAVAGGAGLFTFGLNAFIAAIGWVTVVSADDYDEYLSLDPGAGLVFVSIAAGLGLLAFLTALGAHPPVRVTSQIPSGLAIVGAIGGILAGLGLTLPPPDVDVAWADWAFVSDFPYVGQLNLGAACFYVGSTFAIVAGFALATRWGLGMVLGGLIPLLWLMLVWVGDITDPDGAELSQIFKTDLHPLFAVGCGLTVVCVAIGYATSGAAAPDASAGPSATPARWAADPFGRYEHRYWDGRQWTAQVATAGATAHDLPVDAPPAAQPPTRPVGPVVPTETSEGWWVQGTPGDGTTGQHHNP